MNSYLSKSCLLFVLFFLFAGCRKDKSCTCIRTTFDGSVDSYTQTVGPDEVCEVLNQVITPNVNSGGGQVVSIICMENE